MSIIRAIVSTNDPDDRVQVCSQVSESYRKCDDSLSEMVALNSAELFQVMRHCSVLEQQLAEAKQKLVDFRKRLQECRRSLNVNNKNCYTELWPEIIENRAILQLLERAEKTYQST